MNTQSQPTQKLIAPISLHLTQQQLEALQLIWNYADLFNSEFHLPQTARAMPSILHGVSRKLLSKVQKLKSKEFHEPSGKKDKLYKFNLEAYEAVFLEIFIRGVYPNMNVSYERTAASIVAAAINQALA